MRHRMPDTRKSITHKAVIRTDPPTKFFFTVGLYKNGQPGELYVTMNDTSSDLRGWLNVWAISVSMNLQSEVPLAKLVEKFAYQQFDPQGLTDNPDIRVARSIPDYIIRWMESKFGKTEAFEIEGIR